MSAARAAGADERRARGKELVKHIAAHQLTALVLPHACVAEHFREY